jgi:hypothetical protein
VGVACIRQGKVRNAYKITYLGRRPEGKRLLEDVGVDRG